MPFLQLFLGLLDRGVLIVVRALHISFNSFEVQSFISSSQCEKAYLDRTMLKSVRTIKPNGTVAVIGSGVSGLTFTYFINKLRPDLKITVFDEQNKNGGWLYSYRFNDEKDSGKEVMVEKGPRTLRGVSDGTAVIIDTIDKLGEIEKVQTVSADSDANKKFLLDSNDKLVKVPGKLMSMDTMKLVFFNSLGKNIITSVLFEPFRKSKPLVEDEAVSSFLSRRFGPSNSLSDNFLSAIYHGIYADDINRMSLAKTNSSIFRLEKDHGTVFKSLFAKRTPEKVSESALSKYDKYFNSENGDIFKLFSKLKKFPILGITGGLQSFPNMISNHLIQNCANVEIRREDQVVSLSNEANQILLKTANKESMKFDHVRVTSNPGKLKKTFDNEEIKKELNKLSSVSTVLVNFYLPNKDIIPREYNGFGYLVPQINENKEKLLGVIFDSVIEKNFQPLEKGKNIILNNYTKLTLMLGGHYLEQMDASEIKDEKRWIEKCKNILNKHLGAQREDLTRGHWEFTIAKEGIPHFFVGYPDWAKNFETLVSTNYNNKVSLGGMGFSRGPGVPDVVVNSLLDAIKLSGKE